MKCALSRLFGLLPSAAFVFAPAACGGSATNTPAPSSDAEADAPEVSAEAALFDAPDDRSPGACTGRRPYCGVSCDQGDWASCVGGEWTCGDAGNPSGLQCECYDPQTMGLAKCCPGVDGGPATLPTCVLSDPQGGPHSGVLTCPGGAAPYVAEAGATCH